MITLFYLIDQLALGLYLLLLAVVLFYGRRMLVARTEYRATHFELERDLARSAQSDSFMRIIIAAQVALLVLGVQQSVVPYLNAERDLQTELEARRAAQAVDGEFPTPTRAPAAGGFDIEPVPPLGGDNSEVLLLTPTLTPTPVGTIVPNPPPVVGCDDPRAVLNIPANGMRVFQPIPVAGVAYTDGFTQAKVELRGPGTENQYAVVGETLAPVREASEFSQFVPAPYTPGVYEFRLMVFALDDTPVAVCQVTIYISDPPVTATPTPQAPQGTGG